ncbi:hypothetical protein HPB47_025987, partial [Ixodes persulcatus]
ENPLRAQKCGEQVDILKFMLSVISGQLPVASVASSPGPRQDVKDLEEGGSSGDCLTDDQHVIQANVKYHVAGRLEESEASGGEPGAQNPTVQLAPSRGE